MAWLGWPLGASTPGLRGRGGVHDLIRTVYLQTLCMLAEYQRLSTTGPEYRKAPRLAPKLIRPTRNEVDYRAQ